MLDQIKKYTAEVLGVEEGNLTEQTSFRKDLGADSLDLFELVMKFEEEFECEIPEDELEKLDTLGDVVSYIESHK